MKLYSYIVKHDTGFSPNPFWGYCTLACCKPAIRRTAKIGDWVIGLSPKADGNRLIYAMQVEETISFGAYYRDSRFARKVPDYSAERVVYKCGDNIYEPRPGGGFRQLRSMHSSGTTENSETKGRDLCGINVLISRTFYYFGSNPLVIPAPLGVLGVARGHKNRFSLDTISAFRRFIEKQRAGVNAAPTCWPADDDSWKTAGL